MNLSTLTNTDLFHKAIDLNVPTMDKQGRLCKRETLIDAINCRLAKIRKKTATCTRSIFNTQHN